jgi:hypothetical protein
MYTSMVLVDTTSRDTIPLSPPKMIYAVFLTAYTEVYVANQNRWLAISVAIKAAFKL